LDETLLPAIGALWGWATAHHSDIVVVARMAYDERKGAANVAAE